MLIFSLPQELHFPALRGLSQVGRREYPDDTTRVWLSLMSLAGQKAKQAAALSKSARLPIADAALQRDKCSQVPIADFGKTQDGSSTLIAKA